MLGVKRACDFQRVECPQPHGAITGIGGKANASIDQLVAQSKTARIGFDEEQPQLRDARFVILRTADGPQSSTVSLCDPEPFKAGNMISNIASQDIRDESLERRVESVAFRIEFCMSLDQPARIARPKISQTDFLGINLHELSKSAKSLDVNRSCLQTGSSRANPADHREGTVQMGIDKESDITANLQIGPTSLGMVRIYVEGDGIEIPMDFDPEEAEEIADEIRAAAAKARQMDRNRKSKDPRKK